MNKFVKGIFILIILSILALSIYLFIISKDSLENSGVLIKNDQIISNQNMEASPFVWQGKLKYFVAERDDKQKKYGLAIYDFDTKKREVGFGNGLGLASAAVINNTLYVTATKNWFDFGKSEIYIIESKDLKSFSTPRLIYKAKKDQKFFNTSITKNDKTGNFVIAYESWDSQSKPFSIYFLESKDGTEWTPVNKVIFGKDVYVACPTIKYSDNYYYLLFGMEKYYDPNCPKCHSYVTEIARSKDLLKWETSPQQFMVADRKDEGINNADVDLADYNGKTYLFYSIGDQEKWGGMKYATYDGTMQTLFGNFFKNDK